MPASLDGSEFSLASSDSKNPFTVISTMARASFSSTIMNSDSLISTLSPPPGGCQRREFRYGPGKENLRRWYHFRHARLRPHGRNRIRKKHRGTPLPEGGNPRRGCGQDLPGGHLAGKTRPCGDCPELRNGNPAARRTDRPEKAWRDRLRGSRETRRTRSDHAPSHHGRYPGGGFRTRRNRTRDRDRRSDAHPREGPAGVVRGGDRCGMRQGNAGGTAHAPGWHPAAGGPEDPLRADGPRGEDPGLRLRDRQLPRPRDDPRPSPRARPEAPRLAGTLLSRIPEMNQECPRRAEPAASGRRSRA